MKEIKVVGVDLGGTNIKAGLVDPGGKIIARGTTRTKAHEGGEVIADQIAGLSRKVAADGKASWKEISGMGIGFPGLIDSNKGVIHTSPNLPRLKDVHLKKLMEGRLGIPVFVDNDVNVVALGELTFGAGVGVNNLICMTLGTGIGGGVIIDGRIHRGNGMTAGEIGHIPINREGPACNCGGKGCLESYTGSERIIGRAIDYIKSGRKTALTSKVNDLEKLTPKLIAEAAGEGDALSLKVMEETGEYLGIALAGVINILDPDIIVIGGGVAEAGQIIFDPIKRTVRDRCYVYLRREIPIVASKLGSDAGVLGGAVLALTSLQN